jgi:hypothetical protein
MDPCDKMAKLLQCGKENSPEAMADLMNTLENAMTVSSHKCAIYFPFL